MIHSTFSLRGNWSSAVQASLWLPQLPAHILLLLQEP